MRTMLQQFSEINKLFWNGSVLQWVFYISLLFIIFFEKNRMKKIVFGLFPLVMLIVLLFLIGNPFVKLVFGNRINVNLYYVRLFSVIPVFYSMVHGIVLLLDKLDNKIKTIGVCATIVFFVFCGHGVLKESWLQRADNLEKVPEELFEVLDLIPKEKANTCIAFPVPLNNYARQIDAEIKMPYGRNMGQYNKLYEEIEKQIPDPGIVMETAGDQAVDYVVLKNSNEIKEAFSKAGRSPFGETLKYLIYEVSGVDHIIREFNEKGQIVAVTTYDAEEKPIIKPGGYTSIKYEYDRWGNQIKDTFLDASGNVFTLNSGYASIQRKYGLSGLVESIIYLDADENAVLRSGRYETRYSYDKDHRIIEESYYDNTGKPMLVSGIHKVTYAYDELDQVIQNKNYGENNSPVLSSGRYETRYEYDDEGRIIQESYYDNNGQLMNLKNTSIAIRNIQYDIEGYYASESYLDMFKKEADVSIKEPDNMVWNGDFRAGEISWKHWGYPKLCEIVCINNKNWMHIVSSGAHWEGLMQDVSSRSGVASYAELVAGETYTLSFMGFAAEESPNSSFTIGIHNNRLEDGGIAEEYWTPVLELGKEPTIYNYTFTPTVNGTFRIMVGTGQEKEIEGFFTDIKLLKKSN